MSGRRDVHARNWLSTSKPVAGNVVWYRIWFVAFGSTGLHDFKLCYRHIVMRPPKKK